jgi:hypothetical protein
MREGEKTEETWKKASVRYDERNETSTNIEGYTA